MFEALAPAHAFSLLGISIVLFKLILYRVFLHPIFRSRSGMICACPAFPSPATPTWASTSTWASTWTWTSTWTQPGTGKSSTGSPASKRRARPSTQCQHPGCTTARTFGNDGDKQASYCAVHKKEGGDVSSLLSHVRVGCTSCGKSEIEIGNREPGQFLSVFALAGAGHRSSVRESSSPSLSLLSFPVSFVYLFSTRSTAHGMNVSFFAPTFLNLGVRPRGSRSPTCGRELSASMPPIFCHVWYLVGFFTIDVSLCPPPPGMVNIKGRRCHVTGCQHRPGFAMPGEKKGKFCATHRQPGMVDVVRYLCIS